MKTHSKIMALLLAFTLLLSAAALPGAWAEGQTEPDELVTDFILSDSGYEAQALVTKGDFVTNNDTLVSYVGTDKAVTIPDDLGITTIDYNAFSHTMELTSVVIPEGVTTIKSGAFSNSQKLDSIKFPNSLHNVGSGALNNTGWLNKQANGVTYAGKVAYSYKGSMPANTKLTLQAGTKGIAAAAFYGQSNLTSVTLPTGIVSINDSAFAYCGNLAGKVVIPDGVQTVGYSAFYGTNLTSITVPNSVTTISKSSFPNNANCTVICKTNSAAHKAALESGTVKLKLTDAKLDFKSVLSSILDGMLYVLSLSGTILTVIGNFFNLILKAFNIFSPILKLFS